MAVGKDAVVLGDQGGVEVSGGGDQDSVGGVCVEISGKIRAVNCGLAVWTIYQGNNF